MCLLLQTKMLYLCIIICGERQYTNTSKTLTNDRTDISKFYILHYKQSVLILFPPITQTQMSAYILLYTELLLAKCETKLF